MRLVMRPCPACLGRPNQHGPDGCTDPRCAGDCACAPIDTGPADPTDPDTVVYLDLYGTRPGAYTTGLFPTEVQDRGDDESYLALAAALWETQGRPPLPTARAVLIDAAG